MFGQTKLKLQCSRNRDRIPRFAKMRGKVECLYRWARILMYGRKRLELE